MVFTVVVALNDITWGPVAFNTDEGILFLKVYTAALLAWKLVTAMVRSFVLLVTCLRHCLIFFCLQMKSLCLGLCSCSRWERAQFWISFTLERSKTFNMWWAIWKSLSILRRNAKNWQGLGFTCLHCARHVPWAHGYLYLSQVRIPIGAVVV